MQDLVDIKRVIGESEIYSIHEQNLKSRAGDYGRDFLGRTLPACLFRSCDYVQASREHRRVIAGMQPLYDRYDVLLAAGFGPAPRLDAHQTSSFWRRPSVFIPSNVTGGPALELPNGFSDGLPLGMQIIGRPFAESTVLRAGQAYQQATEWHTRRPPLIAGAPQPALSPKHSAPLVPALDSATRDLVQRMVARAEIKLDDYQMAMVLEAAPYALEMASRVRQPRQLMDDPALALRLPG